MNTIPAQPETTVTPAVNWACVAWYVGLSFGLAWLVDLALYLTGGLANPGTNLLLQFQMLLPAFSAMLLGAFFFKDSPIFYRSNHGCAGYIQMLRAAGAEVSMAEIGEAWQNGYAERIIRTIKEEEADLSEYECYTDAVSQLGRFLNDVYMHKRIHSSLGYLTPAEFEEQWRAVGVSSLSMLTRNGSKSVQFHGVTAKFEKIVGNLSE
jgi:putative transposase